MKRLLWLDDYRDPMEGQWLVFSPITLEDLEVFWVKSYNEFVKWINDNNLPDAICFDHDLADEHYLESNCLYCNSKITFNDKDCKTCGFEILRTEKTGYDAAKWLVDYCMDNKKKLPLYNIQSANPVGKQNIDILLKNYIKYESKNTLS